MAKKKTQGRAKRRPSKKIKASVDRSIFSPDRYVYDSVFARLVDEELTRARLGHGDQKNLHEAYAVLLEEVDEFWDEIKAKVPDRVRVLQELVQVAAMARRCAEDVLKVGFE